MSPEGLKAIMERIIPNPPDDLGNCRFFELKNGSLQICLHRKTEVHDVSFVLVATVNFDPESIFEIVNDGKDKTEYVLNISSDLGADIIRDLDLASCFSEHNEKIKSHNPKNIEFKEIPSNHAYSSLRKKAKEILSTNIKSKNL